MSQLKSDCDLSGQTFNFLTVIEKYDDYVSPNGIKRRRWKCKCSCGMENVIVLERNLKSGHTKSCGHIKRVENEYDLTGDFGVGWTTNTNEPFYFDLEDYDKIKKYKWYEHHPCKNYKTLIAADVNNKDKKIKFWCVIIGKHCDHINHNTFDNRKNNLRICEQQDNLKNTGKRSDNTSGFIGVYKHSQNKKWYAYLNRNKKRVYTSSSCETKIEAVKLRLLAEKEYFGEFAPQKHLFQEYGIGDEVKDES